MPERRELANAIRALSMDAVQQANSGHPGMPMGMADIAEVLWNDYLQHCPSNPDWINRDRFVISNGHGCMLLYSLLYLTGYGLSLEEIKHFRQLHSHTPGHPEYNEAPGVETTTGPLGQGLANGVGMAIAEKALAAQFNQADFAPIDHYTYVFAGDGCLMEGVSHESCSLAGTMGLGKLIVFYDDNGISIDGEVKNWFTDNTPQRFEAYNWHVIPAVDGHNADEIKAAIEAARAETDRPTLICCQTQIAFGSPGLAGSHKAHGAPLGNEEIKKTREQLGWKHPPFEVPEALLQAWDARESGKKRERIWRTQYEAYHKAHPELGEELERRVSGILPKSFAELSHQYVMQCQAQAKDMATRKASQAFLEAMGQSMPELMGGSADLTGSNLTWFEGSKAFTPDDPSGNYIFYGVREFGMFAIMNGIALHGGFIPYGGTFLTFVDYGRNAVRLAAMMHQRVIFVFTHDSIGLGEDGPTHQPIEHAAMLRMTPGLHVWRPCDTTETAVAWEQALSHQGPTCLLLSRQTIAHQARSETQLSHIAKGGYVLLDCEGEPDAIVIATGSEVPIAVSAAKNLQQEGCQVRVVSMPCVETFLEQKREYQQQVLPQQVNARVAIEAGATACWYRFVGREGVVIGIDRFGMSAPYQEIYHELGLTDVAVAQAVKKLLNEQLVVN